MTPVMCEHYEASGSTASADGGVPYRCMLDLETVRDGNGRVVGTASVFSYTADIPSRSAARPVLFAFNGGPGSSSVFLHFSGLGPLYAPVPDAPSAARSGSHQLRESTSSLLPVADVVFIDPVNTGFGRFLPGADPGDCYSVDGDARCFADLVLAWTARHGRWDSPKYLLGESYGTIRAPMLANTLLTKAALPVDGILLVSQATNVLDAWDRPGNAAGAIAGLPTKAVTGWFHGLASKDATSVDEVFDLAMDYAYGEFATALMKVNLLTDTELSAVARRLEQLTGLDADIYVRNRLWVTNRDFCAQLLAGSGRRLSRADARYTSPASNPALHENAFDPQDTRITPVYAAGARQHLHEQFDVPADHEYRLSDPGAAAWDYTGDAWVDAAPKVHTSPFVQFVYPARIAQYLKQVPQARLFVAAGHYDTMATTGMAEHLLRQYDLPLRQVTSRRYPAGHMMYTDALSRRQLVDDLRAFLVPPAAQ
jgi:carboxypeptidase C (cathepsin A)